jgi:probable F420-dependent oxidoreductase
VQAEQLGFDSVWVNHHIVNIGYVHDRLGQKPYHDAIVTLTWIASKTERVRLGTSVLVLPYLHPMVLAKELATLDQLSGGRLVIGVGVGSLPEENAALGVDYDGRGKYTDEFLEVMIRLWTEDEATFDGDHFEFENLVASPKPKQRPHPPILIGGNRPPALRRVARLGDGWHPLGVSPEGLRERLVTIKSEAAAIERDDVPGEVSVRLDLNNVDQATVDAYEAAGATELVMGLPTGDIDIIRAALDRFASTMMS